MKNKVIKLRERIETLIDYKKGDEINIYNDKLKVSLKDYKLKDMINLINNMTAIRNNVLCNIDRNNNIYDIESSNFINSYSSPFHMFSAEYKAYMTLNDEHDKCYLYCSNCKEFEESTMNIDIFYTLKEIEEKKSEMNLTDLTCSCCGTTYDTYDVLKRYINSIDDEETYEIIDEKSISINKDIINIIYTRKSFKSDFRIKTREEEIIIDLKMGLSYYKYNKHAVPSLITKNTLPSELDLTNEEAYKVSIMMEKYYNENNIKYIDYDKYKEINNSSKNKLYELFVYNMNPAFSYKETTLIVYSKENFINENQISRRSLEEFNRELFNLYKELGVIDKHDIKFLLSDSNLIGEARNINRIIKDINNKIKIYNSDNVNTIIDFIDSNIYKYLLKRHSETTIINQLISLNEYESFYIYDTCSMYDMIVNINENYELEYKKLRFKKLHDILSKDLNIATMNKNEYIYIEEVLDTYNKEINEVEFKIIDSGEKLLNIANEMHICVNSYSSLIEDSNCIIIGMKKGDEYIGCLEITRDNRLIQAKGKHNSLLSEELRKAIVSYCYENKTRIETFDMLEDNDKFYSEVKYSFLNRHEGSILTIKRVS